jgi:hypothetical protein
VSQHTTAYTKPPVDYFALRTLTTPGAAALHFSNGALPPEIQVDESSVSLLMKLIGVGVQVYDYDGSDSRWAFREPQANLYHVETGAQRGIHFVGPYWADSERVLTYGGQAPSPTGPCNGDTASVPYTALYVFWG